MNAAITPCFHHTKTNNKFEYREMVDRYTNRQPYIISFSF